MEANDSALSVSLTYSHRLEDAKAKAAAANRRSWWQKLLALSPIRVSIYREVIHTGPAKASPPTPKHLQSKSAGQRSRNH